MRRDRRRAGETEFAAGARPIDVALDAEDELLNLVIVARLEAADDARRIERVAVARNFPRNRKDRDP